MTKINLQATINLQILNKSHEVFSKIINIFIESNQSLVDPRFFIMFKNYISTFSWSMYIDGTVSTSAN